MSPAADRRWLILAIVGAAFFMTVLDVAIVNVAIPSIQTDLNVTETTVQWVLIAYAITFGGFLLLGGRMADLLGRKRIFLVGLVLFTVASLVCGLANNISVLIGARAVQGVGAAIISPAALSIVTTTFEEGAGAEQGPRDLGRSGRLRRRRGRAHRRDPDPVSRLGVDLLRQRPGRRARVRAGAAVRPREPCRARPSPLRRGRRGHRHRRAGAAGVRDLEGARRRLGVGADDPAAARLDRDPGGLRPDRAPLERAAGAVPDLPDSAGARRERRRLPARCGDLRELPRVDPLRPADTRLVGGQDRTSRSSRPRGRSSSGPVSPRR